MKNKKKKVIILLAIIIVIFLVSGIAWALLSKKNVDGDEGLKPNDQQQYLKEADEKLLNKVEFSDVHAEDVGDGKFEIVMNVSNKTNDYLDGFLVNVKVKDGDSEEVYGGAVRGLFGSESAEVRIPALNEISSNATFEVVAK